jgi:hypothetical protein
MTEPIDFNIRASADGVVRLLNEGQGAVALQQLQQLREGKPLVVQEAMDRYVAGLAAQSLQRLRAGADPSTVSALDRLDAAGEAPRLPAQDAEPGGMDEVPLTTAQRHDVYASMVYTRGNDAARAALERGDRVILGLRDENSTLATMRSRDEPSASRRDDPATADVDESAAGRGVYNDRLVVLWQGDSGERGIVEANRANTEPTALYDEHARPGDGQTEAYRHVSGWRKAEGDDVDGDGLRDLGRLRQGTFEMKRATHGTDDHAAFRPTATAVSNGAGLVQRDTNADGRFDSADRNGIQPLNDTFKIHRGSRGATDSAGCQTIHPDDHSRFMEAALGNADQSSWQYVLTETRNGPQRAQAPAQRPSPPEIRPSELSPQSRDLLQDSLIQVQRVSRERGQAWDPGMTNTACAVACGAREAGMHGVNLFNAKDGLIRFGHRADGRLVDGAIDAHLAANTPHGESLQRMAELDLAKVPNLRDEPRWAGSMTRGLDVAADLLQRTAAGMNQREMG